MQVVLVSQVVFSCERPPAPWRRLFGQAYLSKRWKPLVACTRYCRFYRASRLRAANVLLGQLYLLACVGTVVDSGYLSKESSSIWGTGSLRIQQGSREVSVGTPNGGCCCTHTFAGSVVFPSYSVSQTCKILEGVLGSNI